MRARHALDVFGARLRAEPDAGTLLRAMCSACAGPDALVYWPLAHACRALCDAAGARCRFYTVRIARLLAHVGDCAARHAMCEFATHTLLLALAAEPVRLSLAPLRSDALERLAHLALSLDAHELEARCGTRLARLFGAPCDARERLWRGTELCLARHKLLFKVRGGVRVCALDCAGCVTLAEARGAPHMLALSRATLQLAPGARVTVLSDGAVSAHGARLTVHDDALVLVATRARTVVRLAPGARLLLWSGGAAVRFDLASARSLAFATRDAPRHAPLAFECANERLAAAAAPESLAPALAHWRAALTPQRLDIAALDTWLAFLPRYWRWRRAGDATWYSEYGSNAALLARDGARDAQARAFCEGMRVYYGRVDRAFPRFYTREGVPLAVGVEEYAEGALRLHSLCQDARVLAHFYVSERLLLLIPL